jgi:GDP-4-dehydro-6-deoxy-D-mannose reductase
MRPSDIPVLIGDTTRLRQATDWTPQIPFDQMLDDLLAYWRSTLGV